MQPIETPISEDEASKILDGMSKEDIEEMKRKFVESYHLANRKLPHAGKHNKARALRAYARITKRKKK